jgi:DNA processing protein
MSCLLEQLSPMPVPVDELIRRRRLPAAAVSAVLLDLELAGRLERQPGRRVTLIQILEGSRTKKYIVYKHGTVALL